MRKTNFLLAAIALVLLLGAISGLNHSVGKPVESVLGPSVMNLQYGEKHGIEAIINQEYELWLQHYHSDAMRHHFLELSYFSTESLNFWQLEESDEIQDVLYDDLKGTAAHVSAVKGSTDGSKPAAQILSSMARMLAISSFNR